MPSDHRPHMALTWMGLALVSVVVALVGGAMTGQATLTTAAAPTATITAASKSIAAPSSSLVKAGSALASVATLTIKGRAPRSGYDRALFGQAWADVDRNGCDTRNDVLRRDLTAYVLRTGTHGCLVLSGTLRDPYTARIIAFVRGRSASAKVQIDHVVALSDAWQKGAQQWSTPRRTAYANDSLNLLAVDGSANARKGDGDAATWLPPNKPYRCSYAARQVAVKAKYGLWVTSAERDALTRILAACPSQAVPTATAFVLGGGREQSADLVVTASGTAKPVEPQRIAPESTSSTDPRWETCRAAAAAGYGPYHRGRDPEYDWYRDADHDGMVCE